MTNKQIIEPGGFAHCVFFWLNEPKSTSARMEFEKHLKEFLNASEYVRSKHIGAMAASHRDVVESTYTYCLIATFSSKEDQDKYQDEPAHLKFVEDARHLWERVVVYDSTSIY